MSIEFIPSRTEDALAFLVEREQAEADARADAEWERAERIERAVTFDDVLEEMATSCTDTDKLNFTVSLARATHADADAIFMIVDAAKQRVIARRLAEGG